MAAKIVIVGGGHNGLVAANLLQRSGMSCTVVEAKASLGGACRAELFDGQLVNWGANHLFMLSEEVLRRLQISPDEFRIKEALQDAYFLNSPDLIDLVNPCEIRHFNKELDIASQIFKKHLWDGGSSVRSLFKDFETLALSSGLLFLEGSILDVLRFYFSNNEDELGPLISGRILSKYELNERGTAISVLYLAMSNKDFGYWSSPRDGMQVVTEKIAKNFLSEGGQLLLEYEVIRANWDNEVAVSVQTSQGNSIAGDYFLFSGNPVEFEKIFSKSNKINPLASNDLGWGTAAQDGGCSKIMLSSSMPLKFKGAPNKVLESTMIVNCLSVKEWKNAYTEAVKFGHSLQPYFEVFGASEFHGETQAPFIYSIFVMYSSFSLLNDLDKEKRENLKAGLLASIIGHINNPDVIRDAQVMDPVDFQEQFGLAQGNVDHGRFTLDNILENRRFDLKMLGNSNVIGCGSGFFGGGLVTGVPGMLAANDVIKKESTYDK